MATITESTSTVNFDSALLEAANRARSTYPREQTRINRGLAIVQAHGIELLVSGVALVQSQSEAGKVYQVNGACPCPDASFGAPEGRCSHKWSKSLLTWATKHKGPAQEYEDQGEDMADLDASAPAPAPHNIPARWITMLHGNPFVRYPGLLAMAHERGLVSLTTQIEHHSESLVLASATATFADGRTFTEWADATPGNVGATVRPSWMRMALTRAKARCLRDALGVELCSVEELSE